MKKTALKHLCTVLRMASDEFSNHGCNDMDLPNTPENREFIAAAEMWNSPNEFAENGILISKDGTKIYTSDFFVMDYLASLVENEMKGETE